MACNTRQFEVAKILVASGCCVTARDLIGRPPLVEAARLRDPATLNLLLKANGPSYAPEFLSKNVFCIWEYELEFSKERTHHTFSKKYMYNTSIYIVSTLHIT
jgi:hypothetical protein